MTAQDSASATGQPAPAPLAVVHGNPTAEEVAALAAVLGALATRDSAEPATSGSAARGGRIRRRRELTGAPLPWKVGRR